MPFDIQVASTVRKPRGIVAAVMLDPVHEPDWRHGVLDAVLLDDTPLRAGIRIERLTRSKGLEQTDVAEVLELAPGRFLERVVHKPFWMKIRYDLKGIPEGTIARVRMRGRCPWYYAILGPVVTWRLRQAAIRDLAALKYLLESNDYRELLGGT